MYIFKKKALQYKRRSRVYVILSIRSRWINLDNLVDIVHCTDTCASKPSVVHWRLALPIFDYVSLIAIQVDEEGGLGEREREREREREGNKQ